jgi:cysteine desulfurase/selenocysteine lyase
MISSVTFARTTYAELPSKFEAGTPHIAGAIGLGAAIDYVQSIGLANIHAYEEQMLRYATEKLHQVPRVRILGTAAEKVGAISFVVEDPPLSSLDVGTQLDLDGIAVRTGHHCCQPVMERFGVSATARASFAMYNTPAEIDVFVEVLRRIVTGGEPKPVTVGVPTTEAVYPKAFAASPQAAAETLIEAFDLLGDWPARYQYLIELGKKIPPMSASLKTDANRVRGCQSTVFLSARARPGTTDVLEFLADSDADFVRGELALLERVFSGQKVDQIQAFDVEGFFGRLGMDQNLTLGRRTGLASMVQRIRGLASLLVAARESAPQPVPTA